MSACRSLAFIQHCQVTGMIKMFHRVAGPGLLIFLCLTGCCLSGHQDCRCHQHGHEHRHSGNLNAVCGEPEACTCTTPLYSGDRNYYRNCRKHNRQRPMHRIATAFRRSSPQWMSGPHTSGCECGSSGCEMNIDQPEMWEQNAHFQPAWGDQQTCGCDSCATSVTDSWSTGGWYSESPEQGFSGCGCGEQHSPYGSMSVPEENGQFQYSAEGPDMGFPTDDQTNNVPRAFPPSSRDATPPTLGSQNSDSATPIPVPELHREAVPMPQDMTPMDSPMEFPKNSPDGFDPLEKDAAPAADNILDPVNYELPRLPPIPERDYMSGKHKVPQQVRPITTSSQPFQR